MGEAKTQWLHATLNINKQFNQANTINCKIINSFNLVESFMQLFFSDILSYY